MKDALIRLGKELWFQFWMTVAYLAVGQVGLVFLVLAFVARDVSMVTAIICVILAVPVFGFSGFIMFKAIKRWSLFSVWPKESKTEVELDGKTN